MARTRDLKPGFFTNEELAQLPPLARLLFQGLWCHADREGRLEDRPGRLKVQILPYDVCDADELLSKLAEKGFIRRYDVEGRRLIQVITFKDHQSPHPKEQASTLPPPPERRAVERTGEQRKETASRESPEQAAEGFSRGASSGSPGPSFPSSPSGDLSPPPPHTASLGARAHDPVAGSTERPSAHDVKAWWGQIRAEIFPVYLPWDVPPDSRGDTERWLAGLSDEAVADLKPAMRLAFTNMRDRAKDWDDPKLHEDPSFGFGALRSRLTYLRERLRGIAVGGRAAPARASPPSPQPGLCREHQSPSRTGKRAEKFDAECEECRHVAAKNRPKTDTEPEPAFGGSR